MYVRTLLALAVGGGALVERRVRVPGDARRARRARARAARRAARAAAAAAAAAAGADHAARLLLRWDRNNRLICETKYNDNYYGNSFGLYIKHKD